MQPGPTPPRPPVVRDDDLRPSRAWYVVAGVVALLGVVGSVAMFVVGFRGLSDRIDGFDRVAVGDSSTIRLAAGGYSIDHEYAGAGLGSRGEPTVTVTDPSGADVPLAGPSAPPCGRSDRPSGPGVPPSGPGTPPVGPPAPAGGLPASRWSASPAGPAGGGWSSAKAGWPPGRRDPGSLLRSPSWTQPDIPLLWAPGADPGPAPG